MKKIESTLSSSYLILWSPRLLLFSESRCCKLQFVVVVAVAVAVAAAAAAAAAVVEILHHSVRQKGDNSLVNK